MEIGPLNIDKGILLAPMEGITDLPYRLICKEMGADLVYSEFVSSIGIVRNTRQSLKKINTHPDERPLAIQIFGNDKKYIAGAAKILEDIGVDIVDINFGCWVKQVVNHNSGAAFLKNPEKLAEIVNETASRVKIPVTIKTRLGWDKDNIVINDVAELVEKAGGKAISIHCRTRDMGMSGKADWSYIAQVKSNVNIPVILNGDVREGSDAEKAFRTTGCDAVMVGRAAIGNPFVFRTIKHYLQNNGETLEIPFQERLDMCKKHLQLTLIYEGYPRGHFEFRKHYAGYLKGLQNCVAVRKELVTACTYNDIEYILDSYKDYLSEFENPYVTPE